MSLKCGETESIRILIGKSLGEQALGSLERRWEDNINTDRVQRWAFLFAGFDLRVPLRKG
jgi:hypothetical protein